MGFSTPRWQSLRARNVWLSEQGPTNQPRLYGFFSRSPGHEVADLWLNSSCPESFFFFFLRKMYWENLKKLFGSPLWKTKARLGEPVR